MLRVPTLAIALFAGALACGGERFEARPIVFASPDRRMDQALQRGRQAAFEGDLETARDQLREALQQHPRDPLAPIASVLLARVYVARGELADAERQLDSLGTPADPVLARKVSLVRGVIAARRNRHPDTLRLLRPLDGQLPDRAETGELSCALAESETRQGEPARALRALALIESLSSEGASWLPTGLACEQADTRGELLRAALDRIEDPQTLADTVDLLPTESTMRRPVEVRLHALAERHHEVTRWIRWLGDLPDDTDVNGAANPNAAHATLVVGIMAPGHGPQASLGAALLRGAQFALESVDDVRTVLEDEPDSPEGAVAALDRLYAQGARVMVGVLREDLSAAIAIRAQALGIEAWLVAPTHGVEGAGARVHVAGPTTDARAEAMARVTALVRGNEALRAALLTTSPPTEVRDLLSRALTERGIGSTVMSVDEIAAHGSQGSLNVVLGTFGREARSAFARAASHAPARWVFEARAAAPGSAGVWVGLAAGAGYAAFLPEYCTRVGEPPEELVLVAYDAARRAIAQIRNEAQPPPSLLAWDRPLAWAMVDVHGAVTRASEGGGPAAVVRCP